VTDTLKTPSSITSVDLQPAHVAFLKELANKATNPAAGVASAGAGKDWGAPGESGNESPSFSGRVRRVEPRLSPEWVARLVKAINRLEGEGPQAEVTCSLAHGDFTPWNTFFVDGELYVFDWEYAQANGSIVSDLIHFVLASPRLQRRSAGESKPGCRRRSGSPCRRTPIRTSCVISWITPCGTWSARSISRARLTPGTACGRAPN
jgi:hypothetical protein